MDTQYPEEELSSETFSGADTTFGIVDIKGPVRSGYGRLGEPGLAEISELAQEKHDCFICIVLNMDVVITSASMISYFFV